MTDVRELLGRYLRQRADLGETVLLLDMLTPADLQRLVQTVRSGSAGAAGIHSTARVEVPVSSPRQTVPEEPDTPARRPPSLRVPGTETLLQLGTLDELRAVALGCPRCRLCETRSHVVFGEGSETAELMVVGEAPGVEEDRSGRPFVGRAGKLLDLLLATVGFSRESVYICNVLKCRPPGNRNPEAEEIEACSPYLRRQVELVKPRAILAVGGFAAQTLLGGDTPIGRLRGTVHDYAGVPLVPTYHPAALLRNPVWMRPVWEDLQRLRSVLDPA